MFEDSLNLFPRDACEPFEEVVDSRAVFEILEEGFDRYARPLEHPDAAALSGARSTAGHWLQSSIGLIISKTSARGKPDGWTCSGWCASLLMKQARVMLACFSFADS